MTERFNVIFEKLEEARRDVDGVAEISIDVRQLTDESSEIDELRRLALETAQPLVTLYTIG